MPIDLPEKRKLKAPTPRRTTQTSESLEPGDTVEYGITMEVSPAPGKKMWIRMGTTSSVREGETTAKARLRVCEWVETSLDARIQELSGE